MYQSNHYKVFCDLMQLCNLIHTARIINHSCASSIFPCTRLRFSFVALTILFCSSSAFAEDLVLQGASNQGHVWFVSPRPESDQLVYPLYHHSSYSSGPYLQQMIQLSELPERMASWSNQLWLVQPCDPSQDDAHREVFTIRARYDSAVKTYHPDPVDRLVVESSLPAWGAVAGFIGTADGPVALLWPNQKPQVPTHEGVELNTEYPPPDKPQLLCLKSREWQEVPLPQEFMPGDQGRLFSGGEDGMAFRLFTTMAGNASETICWDFRPTDGTWQKSIIDLDLDSVRWCGSTTGQSFLLTVDKSNSDRFEIAFIRPGKIIPFQTITAPVGEWAIFAVHDGLRIIDSMRDGSLYLRRIDPVTGEFQERERMRQAPLPTGGVVHMLLLLSATGLAFILVILARPAIRNAVPLSDGLTPLPVGGRLGAFGIDFLPGAIVVGLVTQSSPSALLRWPLWTAEIAESIPFLVAGGIFIVYVTLSELFTMTTFGKAIFGARVCCADGSRPRPSQILFRNLVKCVYLVIPPLVIFILASPNLQGLGDLLSRTAVLRRSHQNADQD